MTVYRFTQAPMHASCYVILGEDGNTGILIDPCVSPETVYSRLGRSTKITHVLITHGHFDHIDKTDEWINAEKAELLVSSDDAIMLSSPIMNASAAFYNFPRISCTSKPDVLLYGGEELDLSGIKVKVYAAPGHSAGSLLFLIGNRLFSGDTLFFKGYGRTDLYSGDREALRDTLENMSVFLGKRLYLCPGHGGECLFDDAYMTM